MSVNFMFRHFVTGRLDRVSVIIRFLCKDWIEVQCKILILILHIYLAYGIIRGGKGYIGSHHMAVRAVISSFYQSVS